MLVPSLSPLLGRPVFQGAEVVDMAEAIVDLDCVQYLARLREQGDRAVAF